MTKTKEEIKNDGVNHHILNIVTPPGLDFTDTTANIGENYGKIYCISRYPIDGVDYGWLSPLCNMEGTATTVEFQPTDSSILTDSLDKHIDELKTKKDLAKKESERLIIDKQISDTRDMMNRIAVNQETVGFVNIMLHIQDTDKRALEDRIKRVSGRVHAEGCTLQLLRYKQKMALESMAPYGRPNELVSNMGARCMPITTFYGGFPMANSGINDNGGYYLAKTIAGKLVILNMWLRNKDRVNSNWFISGVPGVGKSTALKDIFVCELAFGTIIVLFDPEREYVELARNENIKGNVISGIGGNGGRINPLQIRKSPRITEEDLDPGENLQDFFTYDENYGVSDMALHIQNLRTFFQIYFGKEEYDAGIKAALEECLIELYNNFNITWDTDITTLENTDFPILSNLFELVEKKQKSKGLSDYKRNVYDRLRDLLYPIGKGADQFVWNGPTNINLRSNFNVIDCSYLLEVDEKVQKAQLFNLISWAWQQMSRDRTERFLLGIDEGYLYVDPDNIELMKFIRNISKRDRKYEAGLLFITHSVVDILGEEVKRYGQAILDNSCYKFIMGCDGKNLEETKQLFNLTEREVQLLTSKNRSEGVLFAGNVRVGIKIEVRESILKMIGTAGGR